MTPRPLPPHRGQFPLSRRQLIIRAGVLGAAGVSLPSILAACGDDDEGASDATSPGTSPGSSATTAPAPGSTAAGGGGDSLFFENWPAYIDPSEDGAVGTVERFIAETGIDMRYTEAYNDNNEYFATIQPVLGRGDTIEPDIIAPTSWMAGRLINLGWVDPLPLDQVPNASNLRADLRNPAWDPTGEFSLPWQTGFAGIAYNVEATGREITSVDDLFDPEFAGRVGMLTEMRDTIGVIAMSMGVDIENLSSFDEVAEVFARIEEAKNSGQIRRFHGNDYFDDLANGNLAITIGWSGDIPQIGSDAVRFLFPPTGATSWADTMVMPKGAANRDAAAQWMNFVYDPANAAHITAWVGYVSPVAGVQEFVAEIDPSIAEDPLIFPDEATLANTFTFATLPDEVEAEFDAEFSRIVGA